VKILHTADIHLTKYGDDRWKTLETLIGLGKQESVEVFVISGDLFDRDVDAENLRPKIREIFSNAGFKIVLIPGNHDSESYQGGLYFGDVFVLTNPDEPFEYKDVMIWGLPFEPIEGEKILSKLHLLRSNLPNDKKNILLYHGELLDAFFSRRDLGDEGVARYMPVKLWYFKDLNIQYVLAGHFHSKFDTWKLENGGYFVYPGSPISITKGETGRRKVNIFEVGNPPVEYVLNTPHFEEVNIELDPFVEKNPVETVEEYLQQRHPEARVLLTVMGYVNSEKVGMSEEELGRRMSELAKARCAEEPHLEFRDISKILQDDLFKNFISKLEQRNYDKETNKQLRDLAIRAMVEARA